MSPRLVASDGTNIGFEVAGNSSGEGLIFLHSLGSDRNQWTPQIDALSNDYRILKVDTRGHGTSDAPKGDYTMARLATDIIELADAADLKSFHLCGLSLGGMMAQWIGIHHPDRLRSLTLANTGAKIGTPDTWNERVTTARTEGMAPLVEPALTRWFLPDFCDANPAIIEPMRATLSATDPIGYSGACAALRDADLRGDVPKITARTLVIASTDDPATPPTDLEFLHGSIAGSTYRLLKNAAHISNIEVADQFTTALRDHLVA